MLNTNIIIIQFPCLQQRGVKVKEVGMKWSFVEMHQKNLLKEPWQAAQHSPSPASSSSPSFSLTEARMSSNLLFILLDRFSLLQTSATPSTRRVSTGLLLVWPARLQRKEGSHYRIDKFFFRGYFSSLLQQESGAAALALKLTDVLLV